MMSDEATTEVPSMMERVISQLGRFVLLYIYIYIYLFIYIYKINKKILFLFWGLLVVNENK